MDISYCSSLTDNLKHLCLYVLSHTHTHTCLTASLYSLKCFFLRVLKSSLCNSRRAWDPVDRYSVFATCLTLCSVLNSHFLTQPPWTLCGIDCLQFQMTKTRCREAKKSAQGHKAIVEPGSEAKSQFQYTHTHTCKHVCSNSGENSVNEAKCDNYRVSRSLGLLRSFRNSEGLLPVLFFS